MNAECGMRNAEYSVETWKYYLRTPNSKLRTQLGFTLIEVIIFIVLAGIILPLIFIPFMTGLKSYSTPEYVSTATFLGEELMEEIKSKSFEDPNDPPVFGPEAGETRATYDDVDDYNGLAETPTGFAGYSRSVTVSYVDPESNPLDLDAPVVGPTSLKRVLVTVTNAEIPDITLALVTLVSQ